jgi:hypothetical protein
VASVETFLGTYLHELQESSGEATDKTSYYPKLTELLDSVAPALFAKAVMYLTKEGLEIHVC